ncbi:MAG: type II toxin-antitoxin system VapB family antitoxin [Candidatus Dormibacteraeota bacterium]|nr:type II toxin-antitoxin system VapB family antitoxin [Candidatus Dormibacteraeota bacterium]
MSLNIKNPEAERLARELADETGESVTKAVTAALHERLERLHNRRDREVQLRIDRLRAIAQDAGPRWKEPFLSTDHGDLLYDERGLPR